ncbi:DEAD/DEAH box helicase [Kribbella sindirgiensis]|uniref:DEAD/DEAH box helicase n=1 Tax=Kribbella sindirgiensis TaxID=1124744 RepID=A0A4R0IAP0_9ACTN|nr:DEAD/DEAH box helicase [Kribbella sindirgiensis]TCC26259.1 DEAD/DEAH box helicase [Kribbella sindirgiensis]
MTQHHQHDPESADGRIKKPRHKKHQNQSYGERLAADPSYEAPRADNAPVKGYRSEQPRTDRGQRPNRNRDDRPTYNDRPSFNRDDRSSFNRDDRSRFNRDDRSQGNRDERPRFSRDDRSSFNRDDRSRFNRDDRSQGNRDERPRFNRDDRPSYNRDDRPSYNRDDRPSFNRDDRSRFNRDDRSQGNRDERPRFNRDDRPSFNRDDRPSYNRDERSSYNRDDRSRFNRDDRSQGNRDERPRFNRDERPSYNRDDRSSYRRDDRSQGERSRYNSERDNKSFRRDERVNNRDDRRSEQAEQPVDLGTVAEDNQFAALGLAPRLVQRLARDGITTPFPIQAATIPDALAGKDVLGRGQTGSGKTLGFGLPTLMRLSGGHTESRRPRGMILVPTRELAMQVHDALEPLAHVMNVSLKLIAGGLPYPKQIDALRRGVDLLIATPGRLIDLCEQGAADLGAVEVAVLDEADHMCDMGFMPAVTTLLDMTPAEGQRLLFSATLDNDVDKIVRTYLKDPVQHSTESGQASVSTMEHHLLVIEPAHKQSLTAELASRDGRTIVFVRTKLGADRIATQLRDRGVMAAALHGGLTQGMRNRTLDQFKDGSVPVLVATDVAARGIHVDDVGLVVQADPPAEHKDYLHRAGRTARAGGKGAVVTLVLPHQRRGMIRMAESAGVKAEPVRARPGDELVTELTGGSKPSGYPVKLPAPKPQRFNKGGGKRFGSTRPGRGHDSRGGNGPRRNGNGGRRSDGKSYQH